MISKVTTASISGMRAGYSEFAISQLNAVLAGLERATISLVDTLELCTSSNSQVSIVDLGAADGVNSFPVIERFSHALAQKINPLAVKVFHVDLPTADLTGLARNIGDDQHGYQHALARKNISVTSTIVPGSFYNSFLPAQSVDILFSTTALHFASQYESPLRSHVLPLLANSDETAAWINRSKEDMNLAMTYIHACLKPGGKLWAVIPGHSRDATTGKISNYWYREVLEIMRAQLQELVKLDELEETTWNNFVLPVHARHLDQWQEWFANNQSVFHLEFLYGEGQPNPYLQRYANEHHDPVRFADEYLASIRAWSEQIITQILPGEDQREKFFTGLHQQFRQDPERFENDSYSVYLGATRL